MKNKKIKRIALLASLVPFASMAAAANKDGLIEGSEMAPAVDITKFNAEDTGWKGSVELGVLLTGGNTENRSINAKAGVGREDAKWRNSVQITVLNTSDESSTTAEKYGLTGKADYKISPRSYLFAVLTYEDDRFSGYEYQATESIGYGYRVVDNGAVILDFEAGPGARQSKETGGKSENGAILRLGGRLLWKISDKASFTQSLVSDVGEDLTVTKSISALQAQIVGNLAMKTSLTLNNNSKVPLTNPVTKKTNSELAVTLVYGF